MREATCKYNVSFSNIYTWRYAYIHICLHCVVQSLSHVRLFCDPIDCSTPGFPVLYHVIPYLYMLSDFKKSLAQVTSVHDTLNRTIYITFYMSRIVDTSSLWIFLSRVYFSVLITLSLLSELSSQSQNSLWSLN